MARRTAISGHEYKIRLVYENRADDFAGPVVTIYRDRREHKHIMTVFTPEGLSQKEAIRYALRKYDEKTTI